MRQCTEIIAAYKLYRYRLFLSLHIINSLQAIHWQGKGLDMFAHGKSVEAMGAEAISAEVMRAEAMGAEVRANLVP